MRLQRNGTKLMFELNCFESQIINGVSDERLGVHDILKTANRISQLIDFSQSSVVSLIIKDKFTATNFILACLHQNITVNPINPELKDSEITSILNHAESQLVISDVELKNIDHQSVDFIEQLTPNEILDTEYDIIGNLLIYTSGTTGTPKGVLLTSEQIKNNVEIAIKHIPYATNHVSASLLPVYHTFTIISDILPAWVLNGQCVIMPDFEVVNLPIYKSNLKQYMVNSFSAVPIVFKMLNKLKILQDIESLKFAVSGAAPFAIQDYKEYVDNNEHILIPCYGMTEAVCFIAISSFNKNVQGSSGKPVIPLRIMDKDNLQCDINCIGEIQISGRSVIKSGYFKSKFSNHRHYQNGSWFKTGDLGYLDEHGNLYVVGRIKNMLIKGGEKVYLEDVESLLTNFDCAASMNSEKETYTLYTTATEKQHIKMYQIIKENLSHHHIPESIQTIKQIPKTKTGKIKRAELVECYK
jgi:acyl-CoA synthetase (AMP-forming)/AMP-acid ligase II